MIDKVLIVGPSNDIRNFNRENILKYKSEGFIIFSYSDSLKFFIENNLTPDYFTFLDPFSISHYLNKIEKKYFKNTILITPDLYSDNLKGFFDMGYTCDTLKKNHLLYQKTVNVDYLASFKDHITKTYIPTTFNDFMGKDYKKDYFLPKNPGYNFCKFSFILLPLVINHFKDLKTLKAIGFGHYNMGRYYYNNSDHRGYEQYKQSYYKIKPFLKSILNKHDIKLSFDGSKSFYNVLNSEHEK